MGYELKYHPAVKKTDLPKISRRYRETIKHAIEERLVTKPEIFGKPLQRTLKGYWKMRVGDYRIVYKVSKNSIRVFGIIHRKEVYKRINRRLQI
jgi:mRNA interferase RelE/StbE